jgi:threonyl-tRNA synthetase
MIHRTVLGGLERFMANLIEHYGGALPVWLSPVQVSVLPVRERHEAYGREVADRLESSGIRVDFAGAGQKLGYRIRAKTLEKVPYIIVAGDREAQDGSVSVRKRRQGDMGVMSLDAFEEAVMAAIRQRTSD